MNSLLFRGTLLVLLASPIAAQACATCGCSLSTDAAMGYSVTTGWRVNLQYDYINQDQLRNRYSKISASQVAAINDAGGDQEVEHDTINRYFTAGITYIPNPNWTISALIPYIDRSHTTYASAMTSDLNSANLSGATSAGLGDIKLIGSYQGFLPTHNLGVQLGLKLPTGRYGGQDVNTGATVGRSPVFFSSGPSAGSALDTSLNPGTGSTDLIVGGYYYQAISQNFDAFVNGQLQTALGHALNQPGSDFRPGTQETVSFGLRYERHPDWVPQLQMNVTHKNPDTGSLADNTDTAGTVVYVSPGITAKVLQQVHAYAFVQVPVFSYLDGYQLFPHWTGSVGLSYAF